MRVHLWSRHVSLVSAVVVLLGVLGIAIPIAIADDTDPWQPAPRIQLSDSFVLAEGESFGLDWNLSTYTSNYGVCLDLVHSGASSGSGGGCGFGVRGEAGPIDENGLPPYLSPILDEIRRGALRSLGIVVTCFEDPAGTFLYGPVADEVSLVEIRLGDGQVLGLSAIEGPEDVDFFVGTVTGCVDVLSAAAENARGEVLEYLDLGE